MAARSFEEVGVWRKAHAWVLGVYRFTEQFPKHELFGLTSQLRRAAVSVPANFAEGFMKRGHADKIRFYNIAQGSLEECRYYFILARDLNYGDSSALKKGRKRSVRCSTATCARSFPRPKVFLLTTDY